MALRVEHKYVVPERLREELRLAIAPFVRPDGHSRRHHDAAIGGYLGYTVRSIYYDTAAFAHFFANEDGLAVRSKPRIRGYDTLTDDAVVFLEVKGRNGSVGSKSRAPIPFASVPAFLDTGDVEAYIHPTPAIPGAVNNAGQFLYRLERYSLQPVVLVTYDREPYIGTVESSLRITFDANIRSAPYPELKQLYTDRNLQPSLVGHFVLEVKHDIEFGFPVWLRPFLSRYGLVRIAMSKYYTCLTDLRIVQGSSNLRSFAQADWRSPPPVRHTPHQPVIQEAFEWTR